MCLALDLALSLSLYDEVVCVCSLMVQLRKNKYTTHHLSN